MTNGDRPVSSRLSHSVSIGASPLARRYETFACSAAVTSMRTLRAAGWCGLAACRADNPKAAGSNPAPRPKLERAFHDFSTFRESSFSGDFGIRWAKVAAFRRQRDQQTNPPDGRFVFLGLLGRSGIGRGSSPASPRPDLRPAGGVRQASKTSHSRFAPRDRYAPAEDELDRATLPRSYTRPYLDE